MNYRKNPVEYTGNIRVEHPDPEAYKPRLAARMAEPEDWADDEPSPFTVVGAVVYDPGTGELEHLFHTPANREWFDTEYPDNGHGYRGSF